jgi:hypothetical protein
MSTRAIKGVATRDLHFALLNRHDYRTPTSEFITDWWEIREEEYDYFLGVLPPSNYTAYYFTLVEMQREAITSMYIRLRNHDTVRFFHCYIDLSKEEVAQRFRRFTEMLKHVEVVEATYAQNVGAMERALKRLRDVRRGKTFHPEEWMKVETDLENAILYAVLEPIADGAA